MAINFPSSPTLNQQFTADDKTWYWDGEKWVFISTSTGTITATSPITYNAATQVIGINQGSILIGQDQVTNLTTDLSGKIGSSIVDAKGDLIVGTAADTVSRIGVGTNGQVLVADSTQSSGVKWATAAAGATGGGTDQIFYENGQTVTTSYTLSTNKNAVTAGPVTINTGVTVTVPSGSSWVVV